MGSSQARIEGVVDAGIIVISHCGNPVKEVALDFLEAVLTGERKCVIPKKLHQNLMKFIMERYNVGKVDSYILMVNVWGFDPRTIDPPLASRGVEKPRW